MAITNKSVLIVVTSQNRMPDQHPTGLWFEEFAIPAEIFRKKGMDITIASLKGGQAPIDPRSLSQESEQNSETKQAMDDLRNTKKLSDVDLSSFDAIFYPGGHGTMFDLPNTDLVGESITQFMETGRVVGAVCHGPAALVNATFSDGTPVVKGRKVTGFTNDEERAAELDKAMPFLLQSKLDELGAEFIETPNWSDNVVVDGKLITGQNPQSSASTANAIVNALL